MATWFRRQQPKQAKAPEPRLRFDPETVAFDWSGQDPMTLRQLCEGMFIPGATGAGKSSTTFRLATEALLRLGAGGVFTTTKPGDAEAYAGIVERAGRWKSLIPFGPRWPARFNLLEYEMRRPGEGAGHPDNLAKLLGSLVELAYDTGRTGQGQDPYWRQKAEELVRDRKSVV